MPTPNLIMALRLLTAVTRYFSRIKLVVNTLLQLITTALTEFVLLLLPMARQGAIQVLLPARLLVGLRLVLRAPVVRLARFAPVVRLARFVRPVRLARSAPLVLLARFAPLVRLARLQLAPLAPPLPYVQVVQLVPLVPCLFQVNQSGNRIAVDTGLFVQSSPIVRSARMLARVAQAAQLGRTLMARAHQDILKGVRVALAGLVACSILHLQKK